jgi:hypothetical protein
MSCFYPIAELLMKHHLMQHSCKKNLTSPSYNFSHQFNILLTVAIYHPCCLPQTPKLILALSIRIPIPLCCIPWCIPSRQQCSSCTSIWIFLALAMVNISDSEDLLQHSTPNCTYTIYIPTFLTIYIPTFLVDDVLHSQMSISDLNADILQKNWLTLDLGREIEDCFPTKD